MITSTASSATTGWRLRLSCMRLLPFSFLPLVYHWPFEFGMLGPAPRIAMNEMSQSNDTDGLLALPDEVLKRIASQLYDPNQLLALALTCKHFKKVVEGVAQTFIDVCATDEERNNLPQVNLPMTNSGEWVGRNWGVITKYQLILKHRDSLQFDQIIGEVEHTEGDKSKVNTTHGGFFAVRMGSSNRIMRSGVHKAFFEFGGVDGVGVPAMIGIARPMDYNNKTLYKSWYGFDPRDDGIRAKYPHAWHEENQLNVVLVSTFGNIFLCRGQENENRRLRSDRFNRSDRVGFLLDMDNGTMVMYINGNHVCEVVSGLVGEYVWVARLGYEDASVRICEWD